MSKANNQSIKWTQIAGIGLLCSLAIVGCSRSEDADSESVDEVVAVDDTAVVPELACDNALVQDRLRTALKNILNQQAQGSAANYANAAEVSINAGSITSKISSILIDVQNTAILQEPNANGMTTCQASVSMTLPSEDLYQASQLQAANNQPSLQTRLAQANIRINNNMLVDDAFSYVIGTQNGQIQARIAGQPAMLTLVSEVVAGSVVGSAMDERRVQSQTQQAERRREASVPNNNASAVERQRPQAVTPLEPTRPAQAVRPVEPITPPTIDQGSVQSNTQSSQQPTTPKNVPKDDSIDMIIIEDENSVY